jgi:hypothetical protein
MKQQMKANRDQLKRQGAHGATMKLYEIRHQNAVNQQHLRDRHERALAQQRQLVI